VVKNKHIYTASSDKTIKRWVAKKEKAQLTLVGHKASVLRLENIDESTIASCGVDKTVMIWDVSMKKESTHTLEGHEASVTLLLYLKDAGLLASGSVDGTVRIWDKQSSYSCLSVLRAGSEVQVLTYIGIYDVFDI
jgi:WD40 repeat protein